MSVCGVGDADSCAPPVFRHCEIFLFSVHVCLGFLCFNVQMLKYFAAFEVFFEENLPKLFQHFQRNSLTPDFYLIDW